MDNLLDAIKQLIKEMQVLTGGIKQDLAYRRVSKFTSLGFQKATLTNSPQFIEFEEPLNQVTIAISNMGTANTIYVSIEGTAGTDSIELNSTIRALSFGDIPIKKISAYADVGSTSKIEIFGLRGG